MQKRILTALVCLMMVLTLLPTAVLAVTDYPGGRDVSQAYSDGDTITIGDKVYTYKGGVSTSGLNLVGSSTGDFVYKAGNGYILYSHNGSATTLTLNNAVTTGTITLKGSIALVLNGTNSTGDILVQTVGSATGTNPLDITVAEGASLTATRQISAGSVTVTGDTSALKTIATTNNGLLFYGPNTITGASAIAPFFTIDAGATVTVNGENVVFKSATSTPSTPNNGMIIINSGKTLDLSACATITSTGTIENNGLLMLKQATDADADIAAINALKLTGSGYVKVMGDIALGNDDAYYTNGGETIHKRDALSLQTGDVFQIEVANKPTHANNGNEISGYAGSGYTLTLGNLIIDTSSGNSITLPNDGNVTVILAAGTTTRINNTGTYQNHGIFFNGSGDTAQTLSNTIKGSGRLEIQVNAGTGAGIFTINKLTIAGGDITIRNDAENGVGIDAFSGNSYDDNEQRSVHISGGKLDITAAKTIVAKNGIILGSGMNIASPEDAFISNRQTDVSDTQNDTSNAGKTIYAAADVSHERYHPAHAVLRRW